MGGRDDAVATGSAIIIGGGFHGCRTDETSPTIRDRDYQYVRRILVTPGGVQFTCYVREGLHDCDAMGLLLNFLQQRGAGA